MRKLWLVTFLLMAGCGSPKAASVPVVAEKPTGKIHGMMWSENLAGKAQPIRGARIYLLPTSVPRKVIDGFLSAVADRDSPLVKQALNRYPFMEQDDPVGLREFWELLVKSNPGYQSPLDSQKYAALMQDHLWIDLANVNAVAKTDSKIDGTYSLEGLKDGGYYLYANWNTGDDILIWMFNVKVRNGATSSFDIHSNNADLVQPSMDSGVGLPEMSRLKPGTTATVGGVPGKPGEKLPYIPMMIGSDPGQSPLMVASGVRITVVLDEDLGSGGGVRLTTVKVEDGDHAGKTGKFLRLNINVPE